MILREMETHGRVPTSFDKRDKLLCLSVCFPAYQSPEKGSTLNGKNFLPGVDPVSEGRQYSYDRC